MRPLPLPRFARKPIILRLPDQSLLALMFSGEVGADPTIARYAGHHVSASASIDQGRTWSEAVPILELSTAAGGWFCQDGMDGLVDDEGEIHLFFLNDAKTGVVPTGDKPVVEPGEDQRPLTGTMTDARLDIWHTRSSHGRTVWPSPRCIWQGYSGSLNSVLQLRSGRIVLPFSCLTKRTWGGDRGPGLDAFTFKGQYNCTVVYSDDRGATWQASAAALSVVAPDIVSAYGAVEPVAVELADGRVWMLIRTQNGRFYESFSADGAAWSDPQPTTILSSDSPPALKRLSDGRVVMFWNNCLRFPYAYGGRQTMQAAVSADGGRTWRGYREVARDLCRHEPPPPRGDHGVGYPFAVVTREDKLILSTGQGASWNVRLLIDPTWLYETKQRETFLRELEEWSVFGTRGVELVTHPAKPRSRVLRLRKTDAGWPAAAVWNFPAGSRGRVRLSLRADPGFTGLAIGLTDHFSVPFDNEDRFYNLFNAVAAPGPQAAGPIALPSGTWCMLALAWDCGKRKCRVSVDGQTAATLVQVRENVSGPCYLRLKSVAAATDAGDLFVESVEADVSAAHR